MFLCLFVHLFDWLGHEFVFCMFGWLVGRCICVGLLVCLFDWLVGACVLFVLSLFVHCFIVLFFLFCFFLYFSLAKFSKNDQRRCLAEDFKYRVPKEQEKQKLEVKRKEPNPQEL